MKAGPRRVLQIYNFDGQQIEEKFEFLIIFVCPKIISITLCLTRSPENFFLSYVCWFYVYTKPFLYCLTSLCGIQSPIPSLLDSFRTLLSSMYQEVLRFVYVCMVSILWWCVAAFYSASVAHDRSILVIWTCLE